MTWAKRARRSLTLITSCCNRSSGRSAFRRACASFAKRFSSGIVVNCANENLRWVRSSPSCSFSLPYETNTIGSFRQSCVSSNADKRKSLGLHFRPALSVYVDLAVIRISVSRANVSIGFRRPPSWIANNPNCLKFNFSLSDVAKVECCS